jgi:hypothetical protein
VNPLLHSTPAVASRGALDSAASEATGTRLGERRSGRERGRWGGARGKGAVAGGRSCAGGYRHGVRAESSG